MTNNPGWLSFNHFRSKKLLHLLLLLAFCFSTMGAASYQPAALPYPVPTNLTATVGLPGRIILEWDSEADALLGAFEIHPSLDGAGMRIIEVPYIGGGHYSYTIVVDDTSYQGYYDYTFRVRACPSNHTACSDPSNSAVGSAIISPPYLFASSGTFTNRVEITFPEYIDGADRIYEVYRADSAGGPYTLLGDFRTGFYGSDSNLFVDSTVVPGTTYYYRGIICNSAFEPGHCSAMSTTPAQGHASLTGAGISATDGTSHEIVVTWDAIPGAIYYQLYRSTTDTPPDTSNPASIYRDSIYSTTYTDEGMTPYRQYYYWVRAAVGAGVYSALSESDAGWRIYELSHNVAASDGTSSDHVVLTWANYDAAYIDAYFIYRADLPTDTPEAIGTSTSTSFNDTSAVPNDTYSYWVQACDFPDMSDPVLRCSGLAGPDSGWRNAGSAPTITPPASTTIDEDTTTGALSFTVGDADTNADLLVVTGASSNTTLLPEANITLSGSGTSRTVTLTPASNQYGSAVVTLTVDDGFNTTPDTFTLTVDPVNDAPTDMALSGTTLAENLPGGTTVGSFSTTDIDTTDSHSYFLVSGTGDSGNAAFAISGDELRTAVVLDYESQNTYSVRIRTDDVHGGTLEEIFTISVTDANDAPHDISLSSASVAENLPVGTAVGTISAQDQDSSDSHTFALVAGTGSTDNALFSVDGSTLRTQAVFDYETQNSYRIRLQADDSNGGTFEEPFNLTITDVDEVAPVVDSIVRAGPNPTNAASVDFTVTFSESVTGVDTTDFSLSLTNVTGASVTTVSGSGDTYTVTVNTGSGSGTVRLDLIDDDSILDLVGNPLAGPYTNGSYLTGEEYTIDRAAPVVDDCTRADSNPTNAASVDFQVVFSRAVSGVDTTDFTPGMTGVTGPSVTGVSGSGDTYTVSVNTGTGSGEVWLDVNDDDSIQDTLGNALGGPGAGNGAYSSGERYYIDRIAPQVLLAANATPGGSAVLTGPPIVITIEFNEYMLHDGSAQAANNVVNYLLLQAGFNGVFDTTDCADSTPLDDIILPVGPVTYDDGGGGGPYIASLTVNGGAALPLGDYRLHICGTTSIEDLAGNELNSGADAVVDFTVTEPDLPATGFSPFEETIIPAQPAGRQYTSMDGLWLEIPSLAVLQPIVGVPVEANAWDLTWLGSQVGYLEGTAYPTWPGNTALTAHVTDVNGQPGSFAGLNSLAWDDEVIIRAGGQRYVYAVRSNSWYADPGDASSITQHEELDWVTLITCRGYDEATGVYRWRTVVRAVLVDVLPGE